MSEHTKGPWRCSVAHPLLSASCRYWVYHDLGDRHGNEIRCQVDDPESTANARLIAAAPDLLAACQAAMECCGHHSNWNGKTEAFLRLMEAAVGKAMGNSLCPDCGIPNELCCCGDECNERGQP